MKLKVLITILFMSPLVFFYFGCEKSNNIIGNYNVITETRNLTEFHVLRSEGSFEINVTIDTINEISIEAEENLIPYIYTKIHGSTLIIKNSSNFYIQEHYPIIINVKTKNLDDVKLSGSGEIYCDSLNTDYFETDLLGSGEIYTNIWANYIDANISGSGEITFWGESSESDFNISGSGDMLSYNLIQDTCYINISGSGDMFVNVTDLLDVTISGSGNVHYKGNPVVKSQITGSGKLIHH